jgi:hypothetical protein
VYPREDGGRFTDEAAWPLIDRALPPALRGKVGPYPFAASGSPPGPYRLGNQMMWHFASGANLQMQGDPDTKTWARIDIVGTHLGSRWEPFKA